MQLIRGLDSLPKAARGCVATIGNFDGLHLGHQSIIKRLKTKAAELGLPSLVVSFEPLPAEFFGRQSSHHRIMNLRDKVIALQTLQVDQFLLIRFNKAFAAMSAESFVTDVLKEKLGVRHLYVGDDFRFGANRQGDFDFLRQHQDESFTVSATDTLLADGERVSSTRIRQVLKAGELQHATDLLGRPYQVTGRVIRGDQLGRQLGFPTANLNMDAGDIPLRGVYACYAAVDGGVEHPAVINLGTRPTVSGLAFRAEVHLLNLKENLYRQHLSVRFVEKLRDEQQFDSVDALKAQIQQDVKQAETVLNS